MISISRFIPLVHLEYQKPSTVVKVANLDNVDIYLQRSLAIKPPTAVKVDNLDIYLISNHN